jgi:hypothetical protein
MFDVLKQICDKLGVEYPEIDTYSNDCMKSKYLVECISEFIG